MNPRNPAIKRIKADVQELKKHPSSRYHAVPLEENMFEWHFTIRGPDDTPFAGGMYHGRIILSPEYPFKPPNIVFLTKNGRFEVGTKICLSISAYHEETWQPAWGVRTMLEALISFLPTEGAGAIGALDWSAEERKKLAVESHSYCCPICGPIAELLSEPTAEETPDQDIQQQIAQLHVSRPHSKSERINMRAYVNDLSTGVDMDGSGIDAIPEGACDVDDFDNSPNVDLNGDGVMDAVETTIETVIEDAAAAMPSQALDQLDNNADADDNIDHCLELHDPLNDSGKSPKALNSGTYSSERSPDQELRHRRPVQRRIDSDQRSDAQPTSEPREAPVRAPPAPVVAPDPAIVEPPIFIPPEDPPRMMRHPLWGRDEDREPWRRFMDKILDIFILLTFMAIMVVSFRILTRLGKGSP